MASFSGEIPREASEELDAALAKFLWSIGIKDPGNWEQYIQFHHTLEPREVLIVAPDTLRTAKDRLKMAAVGLIHDITNAEEKEPSLPGLLELVKHLILLALPSKDGPVVLLHEFERAAAMLVLSEGSGDRTPADIVRFVARNLPNDPEQMEPPRVVN
jgi:hypothetical protein